jgi:hypothetical protein
MSALSTLKTYIKRDFKRTDKDTEIVQAINDAIIWISTKMPHGNYKYQSWINTVDEREDYALPTNLIHLIHPVKFLEGSATNDSGYPLEKVTKEEYDLRYPNPNRTSPTDTGKPYCYTIFSRSILVGPIPDSANYILEISWSKRAVSLSDDADTPDLGAEWGEVIKQAAIERLYAGMGMIEEAQYWASLYRTLDRDQDPVGLAMSLFDAERDREIPAIDGVETNTL